MKNLPVLDSTEAMCIVADNGEAGNHAAALLWRHWQDAGLYVEVKRPLTPCADPADALTGKAAA